MPGGVVKHLIFQGTAKKTGDIYLFHFACSCFSGAVDWLLDLTAYALEELGNSDEVKQRIRLKIKEAIQGKSFNIADEEQLTQVLIEYFC